jgi:hypothetical protein
MQLPRAYVLVSPHRADQLPAFLTRWAATDWAEPPRVFTDTLPELPGEAWGTTGRAARLPRVYACFLWWVLNGEPRRPHAPDDWLLLMEDDIEFHPRMAERLRAWAPLRSPHCVMGTLFNPQLPPVPAPEEFPNAFATRPENFLGAQALLLRERHVRHALENWNTVSGMQSQRLARLMSRLGTIYVHRPSLVQHLAQGSSWSVTQMRAWDFEG